MDTAKQERTAEHAQVIAAAHTLNAAHRTHRMQDGWAVYTLLTQQHLEKSAALAPITMEIVAVTQTAVAAMNALAMTV